MREVQVKDARYAIYCAELDMFFQPKLIDSRGEVVLGIDKTTTKRMVGKKFSKRPAMFPKGKAISILEEYERLRLTRKNNSIIYRVELVEMSILYSPVEISLKHVAFISEIENKYGKAVSKAFSTLPVEEIQNYHLGIKRKGSTIDVMKNIAHNCGSISLIQCEGDLLHATMALNAKNIDKRYNFTEIINRYYS